MALNTEHDLHRRRRTRNIGMLIVLLSFAALIMALSIVKMTHGGMLEGFDHQYRQSLIPVEDAS